MQGSTSLIDIHYVFCRCPSMLRFWSSVFRTYSSVTGQTISPDPLISSFRVIPPQYFLSKSHSNIIAYSSLLARRLILIEWKDSQPPTFGQWIKSVMYHIHLGKIKCTLRGCVEIFYASWQPFIDFVSNMPAADFDS